MEHGVVLSKDDILRLKQWHSAHFLGQPVPALEQTVSADHSTTTPVQAKNEEHLGYYDDGVKRTLTDDQIAMFRNSEIQRLIQERRKAAEREEERKGRQKRKQVDTTIKPGEQRTWTRHFDEAPSGVETLMYDDEPAVMKQQETRPGKFLWPKLG